MPTTSFVHSSSPSRVVFGAGTLAGLPDEVRRLGCSRALLVSDPGLAEPAARVRDLLGPLLAGSFDGAAMHTPVEVTVRALERLGDADCLVSLGGGSATGLGKALALRTGFPQIAIPSSYAGSEVTPVLGETRGGQKTTRSSPEILPETVIYDVELTLSLPVSVSVTSGVNAMAHAVEALYSADATPVTDQLAVQSLTRLSRALPRIVADPADLAARSDALIGAWLAGICLGSAGMGPHHKVCHYLGGTHGMPHAATHTVVLPHAMAFLAAGAPAAMAQIAQALGVPDAPAGMYDLIARLGGPTSLRELGLPESVTGPYPEIVRAAYRGERPGGRPDLGWLTDEVVASFGRAPDDRLRELMTDLVRTLHGFARRNELTRAEWEQAVDFLTRTGQACSDTRQEFVLLSDTLGFSGMVDLLESPRTPETTPSAVLGPFYVPGPPSLEPGADLAAGLPGEPLSVDVTVIDLSGKPVAGAVVDVWQSDQDGFYDVQLPDLDGPVLRGRFHSDDEGRVRFRTIVPSAYPIPDDGPVGRMLAATGRHQWRAPHLHFMISAPGFRRLITQLFVAGGDYLDSDTVFGVKEELITDFSDGRVTFTFRIQEV